MQGMIAHHAQAIYMSHMAASHGANPRLMKLATKIDQSQVAEIKLMQDWLRTRSQTAPDTSSWRHVTMAGMLTAEQIAALDRPQPPERQPGPPIADTLRALYAQLDRVLAERRDVPPTFRGPNWKG